MALKDLPQVRRLMDAYRGLEKREQWALKGLAGFFGLLILYQMVWSTAYSYRENARQSRDRTHDLIQYMWATEVDARKADKGPAGGPSGQSLLTETSRSAQRFGIKPNRLQPEGDDGVSVWFDGVPFNQLMSWLGDLEKRGTAAVRQISIDRQELSGRVNARIVLKG
jgi:type II secretory pathway component PulM